MKQLCILGAALLLAGTVLGQIVYQQDFESGVEPPGWMTWDNGTLPDTWDYAGIDGKSMLLTATDPLADKGAWYNFVAPLNEVQVDFLFSVSAYANPFYEELVSIWDTGLSHQLLGVYFQVQDVWVYTDQGYDLGPLLLNTTLRMRVTYKPGATNSAVTVSWSVYPALPLVSGGQFLGDTVGVTYAPDWLLFGPWGEGNYVVDDLVLTSPIPPVTNPPPPPPPGHGHHGHHGGSLLVK